MILNKCNCGWASKNFVKKQKNKKKNNRKTYLIILLLNPEKNRKKEAGLMGRSVSKWIKFGEKNFEAIKGFRIDREDVQEPPKRNTRWQDGFIFQKEQYYTLFLLKTSKRIPRGPFLYTQEPFHYLSAMLTHLTMSMAW